MQLVRPRSRGGSKTNEGVIANQPKDYPIAGEQQASPKEEMVDPGVKWAVVIPVHKRTAEDSE